MRHLRNKLNHGEKCSTSFDELGASFSVRHDWEFDLPCNRKASKSKLNIEIIKEKIPPRYRQRKAKCAPPPSHKEPRSAQKADLVCSKMCICPFTSTEELAQRTDHKDKEEDSDGFVVVRLNRPQSLVSRKYAPHRTKWSRELERLVPMDVHRKYNSKAQTGGALNNTNISHWSSGSNSGRESPISAFTEEENVHFTLPGSVGKVVTAQLPQGNIVRVTTSGRRSENANKEHLPTEGEPLTQSLPLCLDDEIERNHAKVLSAQAPTTYTSMPIVSETFPVVFNTGQPQNNPFSSTGFHTLDHRTHLSRNGTLTEHNDIRGNKIHAAIIRLTETMQEKHATRLRRRPATKWSLHDYQEPTVDARSKHMERGLQSMDLRVLSADGTLVMSEDQDRLHVPSPASSRNTPIPFPGLKQWPVSFAPVGTVLNGINPKKNSCCFIGSPDDKKLLYSRGKTKATFHGHPRPEAMTSNKTSVSVQQKKKKGFVFVSKPVIHEKSDAGPCYFQHGLQKKLWHPVAAQPFHDVSMSPVADLESADLFASRPNARVNTPNSGFLGDQESSEGTGSRNKHYQEIISIPTAEIV
ncbi:uncharacterized protein LOC105900919 isoform X2 [Clupea harengus]|uniref:Uncharacterized protein LOC105900919 isoform X2 n=1 Tax=Clupea harengus TaxID=7950 RepID=A0A6P8G5P0_CLUHA|nr:uncharacterized protein LOC105900919 isoform X2 [Clupea harengus]